MPRRYGSGCGLPCSQMSPVMRKGRAGGVEPISPVTSAESAYRRVAAKAHKNQHFACESLRRVRQRTTRADAPSCAALPKRIQELRNAGQPLDALSPRLVYLAPVVGNEKLELLDGLVELFLAQRVPRDGLRLEALDVVLRPDACRAR